nr:unnamed protein product [Callosobruchus analis]
MPLLRSRYTCDEDGSQTMAHLSYNLFLHLNSWLRGIRLDQLHLRIAWEKLTFEKLYIQLVT